MKKYRSYGRKRISRRRRYKKKRTTGAKIARKMQNKSLSYIKKKYTTVTPIKIAAGNNESFLTISHVGGKNTSATGPTALSQTVTITDCNPDNLLTKDMEAYQYFKITGVSYKLFFPEGTDPNNTPVQWAMGYSSNLVLKPNLTFSQLQSLQNYQTSSCDSSKPISRYFKTSGTLKRLGIDWCNTGEIDLFKGQLLATTPPSVTQLPLYGKQLQPNSGSSTNIKIYRASNALSDGEIGRLQVTYYVQYKGSKGQSALT